MTTVEMTRSTGRGLARTVGLTVLLVLSSGALPLAGVGSPMAGTATVTGTSGVVEVKQGAVWISVQEVATIARGGEVRTGPSGRALLLLTDGSLLTLGNESVVIIGGTPDTAAGAEVVAELKQGSLAAVVSHRDVPTFAIETPTALVRARGTKFVVTYDPVAELSEVVAVSGQVEVVNPESRVRDVVVLAPQDLTRSVGREVPTRPRRLEDVAFRQRIDELEFAAIGVDRGLGASMRTARLVQSPDRAPWVRIEKVPVSGGGPPNTCCQPPSLATLRVMPQFPGAGGR